MNEPEWLKKMRSEGRVKEMPVRVSAFDAQQKTIDESIIRDHLTGVDEDSFQQFLIGFAQSLHWKVAHFGKVNTVRGWMTPVEADGKGWPDLLFCKPQTPGEIVQGFFAELKVGKNQPTPEQSQWIHDLRDSGLECHLWYPEDWPCIRERLERER